MAPPSKINSKSLVHPELDIDESIVALVEHGDTHNDAAFLAGIHPSTLSLWLHRGLDELTRQAQGETPQQTEERYANLAFNLARAEALDRHNAITIWRRHHRKDWRSIVTYMERRHGGTWAAPAKTLHHANADGSPLSGIGAAPMSFEAASALQAELELRRASLDPGDDVEDAEVVAPVVVKARKRRVDA